LEREIPLTPNPFSIRSWLPALALAACFAVPAHAELSVAAGGPCAVAPQRDPCADGACNRYGAKARGSFSPDGVSAGGSGGDGDGDTPAPPAFTGPGSCADPSAGCGAFRQVASAPTFRAPSDQPLTPVAPPVAPPPPAVTPPTPPVPPTTPGGTGVNPPPVAAPPIPSPPIASAPPAPAPPSAPPIAPPPPAPPVTRAPPPPPVVVEPPPGPVLPPGVPSP